MTNLKVLCSAAALALALPLAIPSAAFAQQKFGVPSSVGGVPTGAGSSGSVTYPTGVTMGNNGAGGFRGGAVVGDRGGGYRGGYGGGGVRYGQPSAVAPGGAYVRGPGWRGGGYGYRRGGFWPGVAAGAVVGGAIAANSYYGSPYYGNSYGYYDDGYYDDGSAVAVVPGGGDDAAYCAQRYKSYDPASGTYLGYDGQRHPCP